MLELVFESPELDFVSEDDELESLFLELEEELDSLLLDDEEDELEELPLFL